MKIEATVTAIATHYPRAFGGEARKITLDLGSNGEMQIVTSVHAAKAYPVGRAVKVELKPC